MLIRFLLELILTQGLANSVWIITTFDLAGANNISGGILLLVILLLAVGVILISTIYLYKMVTGCTSKTADAIAGVVALRTIVGQLVTSYWWTVFVYDPVPMPAKIWVNLIVISLTSVYMLYIIILLIKATTNARYYNGVLE